MLRRLNPGARGIVLVQLLLMVVTLLLLVGVAVLMFREPAGVEPWLQRMLPQQQSPSESTSEKAATGLGVDLSRLAEVQASISGSASLPASSALRPEPAMPPQMALSLQADPYLSDLNNSDALFRAALAQLDPTQQLIGLLIDEELIRKLVVSIDNMAQGRISRKHSVLRPMTDRFRASEKGEEIWLADYNYSRYRLYVELLTAIDSRQWLALYQRYYPQLQQAYAELGYPRQAFHDRVLLALDHLLQSPVITRALPLAQPSVMYTFADPELEQLSAVHKQMLRLGPVNARRLLASLRVLRVNLAPLQLQ